MLSGYVTSEVYGMVAKALLANGPVCESGMAWLAGSNVWYNPVLAAVLKGREACCCQPACESFCVAMRWLCFDKLLPSGGFPPLFCNGLAGVQGCLHMWRGCRRGCEHLKDGSCNGWRLTVQDRDGVCPGCPKSWHCEVGCTHQS